jgi:hypothetical protein
VHDVCLGAKLLAIFSYGAAEEKLHSGRILKEWPDHGEAVQVKIPYVLWLPNRYRSFWGEFRHTNPESL